MAATVGGMRIPVTYFTSHLKLDIEWGHCDPAGIVFNSRFFEFFDTGTWVLFQTVLDIHKHRLAAHFGIFGIPLVEAGANFKTPLKFGDAVELESTVSEFRRSSFDVQHRILKDGALAVEGIEKRVWAGRDPADPLRMRSVAIPAEVIECFKIK